MTKPTIVTRAGKGSALTWTEGDTNLTNLRDATITVTDGTNSKAIDLNGTITYTAGTNVTLSVDNTTGALTINSTGGGASALTGLSDVQVTTPTTGQTLKYSSASGKWVNGAGGIDGLYADANPSLGGNLTVMGYSIISSSNGNINITPNGTGSIVLDGLNWPQADGTSNQVLKTDGAGQLSWSTVSGGASALDDLSDVIITTPSHLQGLRYFSGSGTWQNSTTLGALQEDTAPRLGFALNTGGYSIISDNGIPIGISPGTGADIVLQGLRWPTADGTAGQVLKTNGATQLSWSSTVDNVSGVVAIANGGTGKTSAAAALANLTGFTTTATAAGTTTLTNSSSSYQVFTGSTTQIVKLPSTSTIAAGWTFHICNNSTGNLSLQTSIGGALSTIVPGTTVMATCIGTAADSTAYWETGFTDFSTITGTGSVVLSAAPTISGTLTASGRLALKDLTETVYTSGSTTGTITPDVANGTVQKITATGNLTFNAFANPVAGQSMTLIITQDATGSRTLTSTMKFSGGTKTLSTAAGSIDILTVFYDGSVYYASLGKGFA